MAQVYRQDVVTIKRVDGIQPITGFWHGEGVIARVGVYEYSDGSTTWREFVPPETLKDDAWMKSMHLAPVTLGHPPELVTAENVRQYSRGTMDNVEWEDEGLCNEAHIVVQDVGAIGAVQQGIRELSCGYLATIADQAGEWVDPYGTAHKYDRIQTARYGNHLAIVERGRQGASVALRGDGAAYRVESMADDTKQRLDAANAQVADLQARLDAETAKATKLQAQLDEAKAQTETAKAAVEQARKDGYAEGEARAELVAQAKTVCGADYKADGKDAVTVRRDMLAKLGVTVPDDKSADYVLARLDAALDARTDTTASAAAKHLANGTNPIRTDADDFVALAKGEGLIAG